MLFHPVHCRIYIVWKYDHEKRTGNWRRGHISKNLSGIFHQNLDWWKTNFYYLQQARFCKGYFLCALQNGKQARTHFPKKRTRSRLRSFAKERRSFQHSFNLHWYFSRYVWLACKSENKLRWKLTVKVFNSLHFYHWSLLSGPSLLVTLQFPYISLQFQWKSFQCTAKNFT